MIIYTSNTSHLGTSCGELVVLVVNFRPWTARTNKTKSLSLSHQTASHRDTQTNTNTHTELAWKMVENSAPKAQDKDTDWHKHRGSGGCAV